MNRSRTYLVINCTVAKLPDSPIENDQASANVDLANLPVCSYKALLK